MLTKFCSVQFEHIEAMSEKDRQIISEAGEIIRNGGLVAFPTETVYGLGGNALDANASRKIYEAKGRPSDNPLIVHIADMDALYELAEEVPEAALTLADRFWPGPMTMILKKKPVVPYETTGKLDTVAIRFPSHPVACALIKASGTYIAAPSANTSGRPSPTYAQHVQEDLDGRIDMILDGGKVGIGIESTIIDLTGPEPMILRPGYITKPMLEEVLGLVSVDPAILDDNLMKHLKPKAPGMKYKHYAPKGDLKVVEGETQAVIEKINALVAEAELNHQKTAVIAVEETKQLYHADVVESIGTRSREETIAANLYDILRRLDTRGVDVIYSECFDDGDLGQAVMNRLLKAAGHQVISVRDAD